METFLLWFGAIHLVAYAVAGFLFASILFLDWLISKLKIKRAMLIAFNEYLKRKYSKGETG